RVAEAAIRSEAGRKNNPPDLINVAVEKLVEASLELPAFSTLNKMTSRIRTEVSTQIFSVIGERLTPAERDGLQRLLRVAGPDRLSLFNRLKRPARSPTWSHLREQVAHLERADSPGDTDAWMDGIAAGKVTDFAGEADAADAAVLGDYEPVKRIALIACLAHRARQRARDDLAAMFCKRVALKVRAAKTGLEEIHARQRALNEGLVTKFRTLLGQIDTDGPVAVMNVTAAGLAAQTITGLGARRIHDGEQLFAFGHLPESSAPRSPPCCRHSACRRPGWA
ncbi:MAG: Tn3 family transposase, partial [Streptosporangiaceae bacterium]